MEKNHCKKGCLRRVFFAHFILEKYCLFVSWVECTSWSVFGYFFKSDTPQKILPCDQNSNRRFAPQFHQFLLFYIYLIFSSLEFLCVKIFDTHIMYTMGKKPTINCNINSLYPIDQMHHMNGSKRQQFLTVLSCIVVVK